MVNQASTGATNECLLPPSNSSARREVARAEVKMKQKPAKTIQPSFKYQTCITNAIIWQMFLRPHNIEKAPSTIRAILRDSPASKKCFKLLPSAMMILMRMAEMISLGKVLAVTAIVSQKTASLLKSSNSTAQAMVETAQMDHHHKATHDKVSHWKISMTYVECRPPSLRGSTTSKSEKLWALLPFSRLARTITLVMAFLYSLEASGSEYNWRLDTIRQMKWIKDAYERVNY